MLEWSEVSASETELASIPQAIIKISNISWDLRKRDVQEFLEPVCHVEMRWIHIPIDIESGKTRADIFVEISTTMEAYRCQEYLSNRILKGRLVVISISNHEELLHMIMPRDYKQSYLTESDVSQIINICTNYKTHFSRKCPERPYEYAESIIRLIPWYKVPTSTFAAVLKLRKQLINLG